MIVALKCVLRVVNVARLLFPTYTESRALGLIMYYPICPPRTANSTVPLHR